MEKYEQILNQVQDDIMASSLLLARRFTRIAHLQLLPHDGASNRSRKGAEEW